MGRKQLSSSLVVICGLSLLSACKSEDETRQRSLNVAREATRETLPNENAPGAGDRPPAQTSQETDTTRTRAEQEEGRLEAEGKFAAAPGVSLKGEADLKEVAGGVRIEVEVQNAPPGPKGIHIHQKGDCSDIPGESMGEHYAPIPSAHGLPSSPQHHLGDLGNIEVKKDGDGELKITVPAANLHPGAENSFLGKALVIHEGPDRGVGPSGKAGQPIACAVIRED